MNINSDCTMQVYGAKQARASLCTATVNQTVVAQGVAGDTVGEFKGAQYADVLCVCVF